MLDADNEDDEVSRTGMRGGAGGATDELTPGDGRGADTEPTLGGEGGGEDGGLGNERLIDAVSELVLADDAGGAADELALDAGEDELTLDADGAARDGAGGSAPFFFT